MQGASTGNVHGENCTNLAVLRGNHATLCREIAPFSFATGVLAGKIAGAGYFRQNKRRAFSSGPRGRGCRSNLTTSKNLSAGASLSPDGRLRPIKKPVWRAKQ